MQEVRELIGTRADMTEHLTKMRDGLLADAKTAGKPNDKHRLHGRAEGVELVLRELSVWTQTDAPAETERYPASLDAVGDPAQG